MEKEAFIAYRGGYVAKKDGAVRQVRSFGLSLLLRFVAQIDAVMVLQHVE